MPNLTLTNTDLGLLGAALSIAMAVVEGGAPDIDAFELAITRIEPVLNTEFKDVIVKLANAGAGVPVISTEEIMYA